MNNDNIGGRVFATGATRNDDTGRPHPNRAISWRTVMRLAEYMERKGHMADGSFRREDNWKKGMPIEAFVESLSRHMVEFFRAYEDDQWATMDEAAVAMLFNLQGFIHERDKLTEKEQPFEIPAEKTAKWQERAEFDIAPPLFEPAREMEVTDEWTAADLRANLREVGASLSALPVFNRMKPDPTYFKRLARTMAAPAGMPIYVDWLGDRWVRQ